MSVRVMAWSKHLSLPRASGGTAYGHLGKTKKQGFEDLPLASTFWPHHPLWAPVTQQAHSGWQKLQGGEIGEEAEAVG